jgi:hypothetical protein
LGKHGIELALQITIVLSAASASAYLNSVPSLLPPYTGYGSIWVRGLAGDFARLFIALLEHFRYASNASARLPPTMQRTLR